MIKYLYATMPTLLIFISVATAQQKNKPVDLVIKNTTVLDVLNRKVLHHKWIIIKQGKIIAIEDGPKNYQPKQAIDGSLQLAIPGFVDTHTHLWQHICKSCSPSESLQIWVKIYNDIHYLTQPQLRKVVLAASSEALLSGITTVSDYASLSFNDYDFKINADAMQDAGLDGVIVYDNPSVFIPDSVKLKEIPQLQETYKKHFAIWMGYGPLSFYSLPQVYSGIALGNALHMSFSEHTMENNAEQRDFYDRLKKYYSANKDRLNEKDANFISSLLDLGRPSDVDGFQQWIRQRSQLLKADSILLSENDTTYTPLSEKEKEALGSFNDQRMISPLPLLDYLDGLKDFVSIHSVWLQPDDIDILKKVGASVSHNPESNLYLTSGMSPIDDYRRAGLNISLGTDGAASNDGINMFSAMRTMWNVYKIRLLNINLSKKLSAWDILQAATINGAIALKMQDKTGSIDIGKDADISLISISELGMSPIREKDLVTLLIYSGDPRNVKDVISNGSIVVKDGNLTRFKESDLARDLTVIANSADQTFQNGKLWREIISLGPTVVSPYLYRYESIRPPDSVNLIMTNKSQSSFRINVISSGSVFGGGMPNVIDANVAARFPSDPLKTSFNDALVLAPGDSIQILKVRIPDTKAIRFPYKIIHGTETIEHITGKGQLLIMVQRSVQ